jgi:signal transduction histidine kinase
VGDGAGPRAVNALVQRFSDPIESGSLRPIAAALRGGAIAVGLIMVILGRHPVGLAALLGAAVLVGGLALWRTLPALQRFEVDPVPALLIETFGTLVALVISGGFASPFTLYLGAPVLLLAVASGFPWALVVIGMSAVPLAIQHATRADADLGVAAQWAMLMLGAAGAGWVSRRALIQAEEEHDRTLGRVQQLGHVNAMLSTLHDLVRSMPAPLTVDEIVGVIRRQLDELFDADAVALLLADGGGERWRPVYAEGVRVPAELRSDQLPAPLRERGPHQRPIVVDELAPGEGLWSHARSGAYLWLWLRGQPSGILALEHEQPQGTPADQHDTLERLSVPLALAIDNAVWFTRLRTLGAEEERQRIGAALHDRFAQDLVYIAMSLDRTVARHPDDDELGRLRTDVRDTLADLRETLRELRLRVTEQHDLRSVLRDHLDRFATRFGVVTSLETVGEPSRPAMPIEQQLLRIVEDLVNLAQREAAATTIRVVHETAPGRLRIVVADDGRGLPASDLGAEATQRLAAVRERADAVGATVDVDTVRDEGTTVVVTVRELW